MPRLITLSRAARLVGVKRGALQKRIRQGELRTFEGELLLADLLQAYPQTEVEDTTMLERVEHIMENAVNKIVRPASDDQPDTDTLAARILALGQELARARQEGRRHADMVADIQQKLDELAPEAEQTQDRTFSKLKDWFTLALASTDTPADDSNILAREAFLRVMAAQVRILPSGHEFFIEGSDSILEAGLRGGLALGYGCSNGNCGKCKAKVVSGQVKKICPHDYVLSETEKGLGYILTCSNTAVTDVVLEAEEALGSRDIPQQEIDVRVRKIEQPDDRVIILHAKTPRTKRLRFLAGQYLSLKLEGLPAQDCSIASCPCDDMNLQFHIPVIPGNPFSEQLADVTRSNTVIRITGPGGDFTLNEDSPRSIVFIAVNAGFGPVKSLIEHAMALDIAENLYLYWITTPENNHYQGNLCRSWDDALDNFHYRPLEATDAHSVADLLAEIIAALDAVQELDFYVCAPAPLPGDIEALLAEGGVNAGHLRLEPVRENQAG
ncbi:MAG: 2Fe-2S iron-sulfur cluster binding domain-containing protein [Gammaproteobacteria bacterium]|jgi:CDP-4-dehydro-6-deoxyglucose reductase|nr:2Fe-2S iron-sulfur cluster binding domain-containing protein [Gammaproteobacteria bacterium]